MKSHRLIIQYVAGTVVVVFACGILLTGGELDASWLRFFSLAVLVASGGLLLWENAVWRLSMAQRIPRVPRSVRGTWKGELKSHWVNPETGRVVDRKPAYLVVRQSASAIKITLLTDESKSQSSLGLVSAVDGQWSLNYMYLNKPNMSVEHRSRIHHGSTSLDIVGSPATKVVGRYWTDRDSKGELVFDQRSSRLAEDVESAAALFARNP